MGYQKFYNTDTRLYSGIWNVKIRKKSCFQPYPSSPPVETERQFLFLVHIFISTHLQKALPKYNLKHNYFHNTQYRSGHKQILLYHSTLVLLSHLLPRPCSTLVGREHTHTPLTYMHQETCFSPSCTAPFLTRELCAESLGKRENSIHACHETWRTKNSQVYCSTHDTAWVVKRTARLLGMLFCTLVCVWKVSPKSRHLRWDAQLVQQSST